MMVTALTQVMHESIPGNGSSWDQLGSDIEGEAAADFSGVILCP